MSQQSTNLAIDPILDILDVEAIDAESCRRDLYFFLQHFWDEISNDKFKPNWHIVYLCKELMDLARRVAANKPRRYDLVINVPPGSTKSATATILFPVWCWINWYWMRFIAASYSASLSLDLATKARDVVLSEKFKHLFPEIEIKQDEHSKSNFRIIKQTYDDRGRPVTLLGGSRISTSVGGTITGKHGHILIVDDPIDPTGAISDAEIVSTNHWMDNTLSRRKIDATITPTVLIMQRLAQNDPSGHMLGKDRKNIKHICIPGEIRGKYKVNPPELIKNYVDGLMDPVRMGWDVLEEAKVDLGQYGYAGQIGQNPVPPKGGMFKVDHFQILDAIFEPDIVLSIRYWDKAATADGGAYTCGTKIHKMKSGKYIIADVKRGQWSTEEREQIIRETAEADGRRTQVYLEQEPGSGGKDSVLASIRNLAGFAVYADRPTGDKVYRADSYSVQVNNGNVLMVRGPWNVAFIEEHRFFPRSQYKDQVDSASGAFNRLAEKRVAGSILRRR